MANNMEDLLMGGDDSSSGESDGEEQVNVPAGGTAASAVAAAVVAPQPATTPPAVASPAPAPVAPPPVVAPPPPTAGGGGGGGQSDQMARLKSLYQQQPKRTTPTPNSGASTPQTTNRSSPGTPAPPQYQQPPPQQMQYRQNDPATPQQQQHQQLPVRPLQPNRPHPQAAQQQVPQPQQQQQPPPQYRQAPPQQQQYHRGSSGSSQPSPAPMGGQAPDPFAPTPLDRIKEHQQHKLQQQSRTLQIPPQQQQRQQIPGRSSTGGPPQDRAAMEREMRKQKEKFLMFTRVLIKYLEQKDPTLHQKAKLVIKDCADRNKRQEKGYESVTAAMRTRLKELVGDNYWQRAEAYLKHFLEQKRKNQQGGSAGAGASSSSSSRPSGSSSTATSAAAQAKQQKVLEAKQRKMQQAQQKAAQQKKKQEAAAAKAAAKAAPTIQQVQKDIATQKAKVTAAGGKGKSLGKSAGKVAVKKTVKRKSTGSSAASRKAAATAAAATKEAAAGASGSPNAAATSKVKAVVAPLDPDALPPREYNELMKLVDHAIDFDWKTAGLLLGPKVDLQLTEEQQNLLYGEHTGTKMTSKPEEESERPSGVRPGWSNRNVVTARNAWAAIRLRELKQYQRENASQQPVVGDAGFTLAQTTTPKASKPKPKENPEPAPWVNEEQAEDDVALAMISEGTQIFLRGVLEKAIQCARQRQNLDGVRLWHQQMAHAAEEKKAEAASSTDEVEKPLKKEKPALSLRLGCDVERQEAQAFGNAAMTVKRMEQALARQSGVPSQARVLKGETLHQANSMSNLAMRPLLAKGVENADLHGKRQFEIYGGKDAMEPPLGRVPKAAKLEAVDFVMGSLMSESLGRHRARNAGSSIYF